MFCQQFVVIQHCYTRQKCGAVHTVSRETDRPGLSLPANKVSSLPTNKLPSSCGGALLSPPGLHAPHKMYNANYFMDIVNQGTLRVKDKLEKDSSSCLSP